MRDIHAKKKIWHNRLSLSISTYIYKINMNTNIYIYICVYKTTYVFINIHIYLHIYIYIYIRKHAYPYRSDATVPPRSLAECVSWSSSWNLGGPIVYGANNRILAVWEGFRECRRCSGTPTHPHTSTSMLV